MSAVDFLDDALNEVALILSIAGRSNEELIYLFLMCH